MADEEGNAAWDHVQAALEGDGVVTGTILARVKGGLSVMLQGGVKAFFGWGEWPGGFSGG